MNEYRVIQLSTSTHTAFHTNCIQCMPYKKFMRSRAVLPWYYNLAKKVEVRKLDL